MYVYMYICLIHTHKDIIEIMNSRNHIIYLPHIYHIFISPMAHLCSQEAHQDVVCKVASAAPKPGETRSLSQLEAEIWPEPYGGFHK